MLLHTAKEIIDMIQILGHRMFTGADKKNVILPCSSRNLRKWYQYSQSGAHFDYTGIDDM